jgi:hypothetical protein
MRVAAVIDTHKTQKSSFRFSRVDWDALPFIPQIFLGNKKTVLVVDRDSGEELETIVRAKRNGGFQPSGSAAPGCSIQPGAMADTERSGR